MLTASLTSQSQGPCPTLGWLGRQWRLWGLLGAWRSTDKAAYLTQPYGPLSPFSEDRAALGQADRLAHFRRTWASCYQWSPASSDSRLQTSPLPQMARKGKRNPRLYLWGRQCLKPTTSKSSHSGDRTATGSVQGAGEQGPPPLKAWKPSQPLDSPSSGLPSHPWGLPTCPCRLSPFTWASYNRPPRRTGTSAHLSFHLPLKFISPAHLLWWEANSGQVKDGVQLPHALSGKVWNLESVYLQTSTEPTVSSVNYTPIKFFSPICNFDYGWRGEQGVETNSYWQWQLFLKQLPHTRSHVLISTVQEAFLR